MRVVKKTPQSLDDLSEIGIYFGGANPSTEIRFYEAAEAAFRNLLEMPRLGRMREFKNPRLKDIRMWRISGFEKYLVFYTITEDGIEIVRVIHGARDIEAIFEGPSD